MAIAFADTGGNVIEVLDRVLDKGIVIDAWVRLSLVGIDLLTVEVRVVVASIATYLHYADLATAGADAAASGAAVGNPMRRPRYARPDVRPVGGLAGHGFPASQRAAAERERRLGSTSPSRQELPGSSPPPPAKTTGRRPSSDRPRRAYRVLGSSAP
jgi:hypothetical protein